MSDTSGQDSGGGGGGGDGNNGIFGNPTFQKLLQKTIGLVAQLHGGADPAQAAGNPSAGMPMPGMVPGQQQSNITPGTFQSPQGAVGGALLSGNQGATNPSNIIPPQGGQQPQGLPPTPQFNQPAPAGPRNNYVNAGRMQGPMPSGQTADQLPPQGGGSGGGQGSAPPSGATGQRVFPQAQMGQTLGAPQLPQQGYGGGGGGGGGGSFAQAPWMVSPLNDYAAFSKANPMPKAPTYEDAMDYAEKLRQGTVGGSMQPGAGGGIGTSPGLVDQVMSKMNEQYGEQLKAHTGAWTGQVQAGHAHNQSMAEAERERHNKAKEGIDGQKAADSKANQDRKFNGLSAAQQARLDQHTSDQASLMERYHSTADTKQREAILADARKESEDFYKSITAKSYAGANANDSKATQAASDEAQKGPPGAAAPAGAGQPVKVSSPDEASKLPSGTPIILPDGRTGRVP